MSRSLSLIQNPNYLVQLHPPQKLIYSNRFIHLLFFHSPFFFNLLFSVLFRSPSYFCFVFCFPFYFHSFSFFLMFLLFIFVFVFFVLRHLGRYRLVFFLLRLLLRPCRFRLVSFVFFFFLSIIVLHSSPILSTIFLHSYILLFYILFIFLLINSSYILLFCTHFTFLHSYS